MRLLPFISLVLLAGSNAMPNRVVEQGQIDDVYELISNSTNFCTTCNVAVALINGLLHQPLVEKYTSVALLIEICIRYKIQGGNPFVCQGYIESYFDIWSYTYLHKYGEPDHLCHYLSLLRTPGKNCDTPIDSLEWHIEIANGTEAPAPKVPATNAPKMRIVHITDLHWDPQYMEYSEADCNIAQCCRPDSVSDNATTGSIVRRAGYWGTVANCDMPKRTLVEFFKHLNETSDSYDVIYWTGDLPPHDVWNQTMEQNLDVAVSLIDLIHTYLPHKTIYPAIGNHEAGPIDDFPPEAWFSNGMINDPKLHEKYSIVNLYGNLSMKWPELIDSETQMSTIKSMASYAIHVADHLKLISINTQYCDILNYWLYLNSTDPDGVLKWLASELQDAEDNGDIVHIIGHIPTGATKSCLKWWSTNYHDLVNRYKNTIHGQFFGHTHDDSFTMFYEDANHTKDATNVLFVAPSFTTWPNHNSAYRSYDLSGWTNDLATSYVLTDHTTYVCDPTMITANFTPKWEKEYSAMEEYKLQSMLPNQWRDMLEEMIHGTNGSYHKFETYMNFHWSSTPTDCDDSCQKTLLCEIRQGKAQSTSLCDDIYVTPSFIPPVTASTEALTTNTPDPYCWYCIDSGGSQTTSTHRMMVSSVLLCIILMY